jgi:ankyrin repeat protein
LPSGFTPFLFACRAGHIEAAKTLIAKGVDVKQSMHPEKRVAKGVANGTSALTLAIENAHFELAAVLLEAGADPNDQRSGYTPLHQLSWVRKPNRGDGDDGAPPPEGSGKIDSLEFVRRLVKHGADVNTRLKRGKSGRGRLNERGASAFLMAADTADVPFMKLLAELGADPLLPNNDGCTPLMAAAGMGTYAPGEEAGTEEEAINAVKYLLELGADINTVDKNGETAMHGAAYANMPKMAALVAEKGADIKLWNKKNKYGWTPLLIAEGHRAGNFKPAPTTIAAIQKAMRAQGVEPPKNEKPQEKREGYEDK